VADLPEHSCDPYGEHCLGCCPGWPGCTRASHQPPNAGDTVTRFVGIWNWEAGWPGPADPPKRMPIYGEDIKHGKAGRNAPGIGGPSR